jgi:hypothetical protein
MADGEKRIDGAGVDIHQSDSRGKAYFAGRLERRQVQRPADGVCILQARPGGGRRMKASP